MNHQQQAEGENSFTFSIPQGYRTPVLDNYTITAINDILSKRCNLCRLTQHKQFVYYDVVYCSAECLRVNMTEVDSVFNTIFVHNYFIREVQRMIDQINNEAIKWIELEYDKSHQNADFGRVEYKHIYRPRILKVKQIEDINLIDTDLNNKITSKIVSDVIDVIDTILVTKYLSYEEVTVCFDILLDHQPLSSTSNEYMKLTGVLILVVVPSSNEILRCYPTFYPNPLNALSLSTAFQTQLIFKQSSKPNKCNPHILELKEMTTPVHTPKREKYYNLTETNMDYERVTLIQSKLLNIENDIYGKEMCQELKRKYHYFFIYFFECCVGKHTRQYYPEEEEADTEDNNSNNNNNNNNNNTL